MLASVYVKRPVYRNKETTGTGITSALEKIKGKGDYTSSQKKLIKKYKDKKINGLKIKRAPVSVSAIIKLGEKLGAFDLKSQEYSKLYHLYMIITLENGKEIIVQKNEILDISVYKKKKVKGEEEVSMPSYGKDKNITFGDFLNNGQEYMGDNKYFNYSPLKNNCQDYIMGLLNGNPPLGSLSVLTNFVKQDVETLVKSNAVAKTMKGITDIAGVASSLFS